MKKCPPRTVSHLTDCESQAINSLRFLCVLSVVMIHCNIDHLIQKEYIGTIHDVWAFLMTPTLELLFIISGYLFFLGYNSSNPFSLSAYKYKIEKRVKSLILPYVIWCLIGFLFRVYVLKDRSFDIQIYEFAQIFMGDSVCGHPAGRAMWYVKSLICISFMSPVYYLLLRILGHLTPFLCLSLIRANIHSLDFPFFNEYFLIGAYLAYIGFRPSKFVIPIKGLWQCRLPYKIPSSITSCGMFIYCSHAYLTGGIRNFLVPRLGDSIMSYVMDMIFTWTISVFICMVVFFILKISCRPVLQALTGGRS